VAKQLHVHNTRTLSVLEDVRESRRKLVVRKHEMTLRVTVGVVHLKMGGSQNDFKILPTLFVEIYAFFLRIVPLILIFHAEF
jgi:methyl coenzyme M reductase subunit D